MSTLFVVSFVLLGVLLTLRHIENSRETRLIYRVRNWLDDIVVGTREFLKRAVAVSIEYVHRDILMRFLHIISYLTLLSVQWVERKLVVVTRFFRTVRRPQRPKRPHNKDSDE